MGFSVSTLTDFTREDQSELLVKALFTGATADFLKSKGQIVVGVKSSKALPLLASTIYFQADGCSNTTSGATAITDRDITVGAVKLFETLCPKDLDAKFTQQYLSPGAAEDLGPFEKQIGEEKAALIAEAIETAIWQGDTTGGTGNNAFWNGFLTILSDLGFGGVGDPIEGNPAAGIGGVAQQTAMNASTIDECLKMVWLSCTTAIKQKGVFCFMGVDQFDNAIQNLKDANLYHYTPEAATSNTLVWPGTRMTLVGVPGMDGTNKLVATWANNLFLGTDMLDEEESYKFWYSEDDDIVKFKANFKYGTQIAFPAQVVYFVLP